MATNDRVTIELYVDDQGTVKIRNAKVATEELTQASTRGSADSKAAADDFAASLMKQIGVYALVISAAYKLGNLVVDSFKAGIQAVDDYKLTTIGVAATLTDMAEDQSKGQENFNQALAYSQGMYNELELAAARYFASGKDMTQAWNILAQKGIVLKHEEIDALGIIVDRVKLSTQGQVASLQIAQELRSMITGQARATDQVGMLLKDRIPNLEQELQKHREIGDVVTWLASQFKGLQFANGKIQETLESQYSTLGTLLTQVGRGGLMGAYQDIVNLVSDINEYLTTHKDDLMVGIAKGWATIAWIMKQAADYADRINKAASIEMPKDPSQKTFGQQIAANINDAFWRTPGALVDITTSGINKAWDFASRGAQGWMTVIQEAYALADKADAAFYKELQKTSDFLGNSSFWKIAVDTEGSVVLVDALRGKIQGVIDLISRPFNFVINAVLSGLPSWLVGGGPAPGATPERKLTIPDTSLAAAQEQARLKALGKSQILSPDFGMLELPDWATQWPDPPKSKKPGSGGGGGGGGGGAGGGKGRDTTESLESLLKQLNEEKAKLTEGAFAGVEAWADKLNAKVRKLAMDDEQLKQGMLAVSELKAAKEQKISDDLNKRYLGEMHKTTEAQLAEDTKKLSSVKGHAKEEDQVREVMAQHALERAAKLALEENQQAKTYYDSLAETSLLLADQVAWKAKSLRLDKQISEAQLEQWFVGKEINEEKKDTYRGLLAMVNVQKQFNAELENAKGLQSWAFKRVQADKQKNNWADFMEGAESFITDAWTQGIQGALSKTKIDFMELVKTMAQSFVLNLGKEGIHKLFSEAASAILGKSGKPDGSAANPLHVTTVGGRGLEGGGGLQSFEKKAEKIGYTLGGGQDKSWADQTRQLVTYEKLMDQMYKGERRDLGGIQKLQDHYWKDLKRDANTYSKMQDKLIDQNQELFKTDYLTDYQSSFTGMVGNITSVWQLGQGLMTVAGVTGEAQRYGAMVSYGLQGISLITQLAKGKILVDAAKAAAAGYSSVMEALPWPINIPVAVAWGALAFAGTMAAGMIKSSAGGDYQVGNTGLRLLHQDETVLPAWAAEGWRDIVKKGVKSGVVGKFDTDSGGQAGQIIQHHTTTHITVVTQDGKVISKQTKREIINLIKDKDVQREIGVRTH